MPSVPTGARGLSRVAAPALIVAAVALQFAPVFAGRVYRFEDIAGYFEPLWSAVSRQMRAGHLPLWDRGAWSGQPLLGDPQSGAFYPFHWLWFLVPILRAYALLAFTHAAWAGLGMYALCRVRGRSRSAAATGGLALALGAFVVLQVRHLMFVEATAWLPWVAACGLRLIDAEAAEDRRGRLAWLAATALSIGLLLATGGVSMIYFGAWFLLVVLGAAALGAPRPARATLLLGAATLLGVGLAAPTLAPMLAHAHLSPRALGVDDHFAGEFAWKHYGYLATLAVPNPFGDQAIGTWRGGGTQWELGGYYAGMLVFALTLVALASGERGRRGERIALALLVLFAIGLAREGSLVQRAAYRALPLLAATRCPARGLYVYSLAAPLLAADGLDALRARVRRPRLLAALAVAFTAADLLVTHRHENPAIALGTAQAESDSPARAFLAAHPGDRYVNDVHAEHWLHGSGLLWGLENASGYSSLPLWRYLHYLWIANHGAVYPHPRLHDDLSAQGLWRFSSPLVDALGVRFVLTRQAPNGPGYTLRHAGADGLSVYENTHALPRAFVVHHAIVVDGAAGSARAIADPAFDPRASVVLEQAPGPMPDPAGAGFEPASAVALPSPTELRATVEIARAGVLVISEPWHPDRRAFLDGAPTPLLPADHALSAVSMPAGRHEVRLVLGPGSLRVALPLAGLVAALLLLLALAALIAPPRPANLRATA